MAGGRGERFWPLSTPETPKPFHKLIGDKSMLQRCVERIRPLFEDDILLILESSHLELAKSQLPYIPDENYIIEPVGRDTAACIGLASIYLKRFAPEAIMVVLAADHHIPDEAEFAKTLNAGIDFLRENDSITTLGIEPDRPEIGYGYIERGEEVANLDGFGIYKVERFVEKPDIDTARQYLESRKYYWNSGMFLWRNSLIQRLLSQFMPDHYRRLKVIAGSIGTPEEQQTLEQEFSQLEKISIDFGVLEKAEDVFVIPASFKWDDVGTWTSLRRVLSPDENGNISRGKFLGLETQDCVICAQDQLIATMGVKDLVIVQANGKVLVTTKECAPDLKKLVHLCKE